MHAPVEVFSLERVNLAAVKVLEQRTRNLQEQIDARDGEIMVLNRDVTELRQRLSRLEKARRSSSAARQRP